jgi:hypothetical protein
MGFEIAAALDVVLADGTALRIDGDGRDLDISIKSDAAALLRTLAGARKTLPLLRAATETLARSGIAATIRVGGRTIGHIGRDVESDGIGKLLRVPYLRLGA